MDSLPFFRRTIADAQLEDVVIAIVGDSPTVAARWATQLGFVFIDGAHSEVHALADYDGWAGKLAPNGLLAIHDVFDDPSRGGQGPFRAYERAKRDGFTDVSRTGSLRVLRKP
jgi:predicted O-methyltransferase YrrM